MKRFEVVSFGDPENAIQLLKDGKVDVVMGMPAGRIDLTEQLSDEFRVTQFSSLAFAHLFVNSEGRLKEKSTRHAVRIAIDSIKRKFASNVFQPIDTYLPTGLMPSAYYQREPLPLKPAATPLSGSIRILLVRDWAPKGFAGAVVKVIKSTGLNPELAEISKQELFTHLEAKDYDLILSAYLATFPDPVAFADVLRPSSKARMGVFPTEKLIGSIDQAQQLSEPERTFAMSSAFIEFEREHWILPLFQMHLPVIAETRVDIPKNHFRFENEIWKFFWKTEK